MYIWYNVGLSKTRAPQKVYNKPTKSFYLVGIQHLVAKLLTNPGLTICKVPWKGSQQKVFTTKSIYWCVLDVFFLRVQGCYANRSFSIKNRSESEKWRGQDPSCSWGTMITTWAKSRPGHKILNGQENYSKGTNPLVQTSLRTESSYLKVLITLKFHICFFLNRGIYERLVSDMTFQMWRQRADMHNVVHSLLQGYTGIGKLGNGRMSKKLLPRMPT